MQEMVKIISPKYSPSVELQNAVLGLIQVGSSRSCWQYAILGTFSKRHLAVILQ
jgi:hypothetical protein